MALNKVIWVGRFTGPKQAIAQHLVNDVARHLPELEFTLIGEPRDAITIPAEVKNVQLQGFVEDINSVLSQYDVVIGAGRVVLEAMQLKCPVIAIGENRYIGIINKETIDLAKQTNFGDCDQLQEIDYRKLRADLALLTIDVSLADVENYEEYLQDYQADYVAAQVMNVYQQADLDRYLNKFREIPILTYHRVVEQAVENSRFNVFITRQNLSDQILNLKRRGYEFTTFFDILNGHRPRKPIILTFDDGYKDNHDNLLPLLKEHDAKAVIFVLGNRDVRRNEWDVQLGEVPAELMTDEEILACHRSGFVEIASHGLNHRHLPQCSDIEASEEILSSKQQLETLLGTPVVSFAYPYGDYATREASLVEQAGYVFGIGTVNGPVKMAKDRYRIRRITMFPNTKPLTFWKKTSGFYLRYCYLKRKDF